VQGNCPVDVLDDRGTEQDSADMCARSVMTVHEPLLVCAGHTRHSGQLGFRQGASKLKSAIAHLPAGLRWPQDTLADTYTAEEGKQCRSAQQVKQQLSGLS
jgi:hypothetical protein